MINQFKKIKMEFPRTKSLEREVWVKKKREVTITHTSKFSTSKE